MSAWFAMAWYHTKVNVQRPAASSEHTFSWSEMRHPTRTRLNIQTHTHTYLYTEIELGEILFMILILVSITETYFRINIIQWTKPFWCGKWHTWCSVCWWIEREKKKTAMWTNIWWYRNSAARTWSIPPLECHSNATRMAYGAVNCKPSNSSYKVNFLPVLCNNKRNTARYLYQMQCHWSPPNEPSSWNQSI